MSAVISRTHMMEHITHNKRWTCTNKQTKIQPLFLNIEMYQYVSVAENKQSKSPTNLLTRYRIGSVCYFPAYFSVSNIYMKTNLCWLKVDAKCLNFYWNINVVFFCKKNGLPVCVWERKRCKLWEINRKYATFLYEIFCSNEKH